MIWKETCGLDEGADVDGLMVCSDHFNLDDYVRNYKEEFLNPNFKRTLKKDVVPTKKTGTTSTIAVELSESDGEGQIDEVEDDNSSKSPELEAIEKPDGTGLEIAIKENNKLYRTYRKLLKQQNDLQKEIDEYNVLINKLRVKVENGEKARRAHCYLSKVFSPAQIELLKGKKRRVYWSDDDLASAFTMRHMGGRECYLYLKNTLGLPLPALSCVQKWAASCNDDRVKTED